MTTTKQTRSKTYRRSFFPLKINVVEDLWQAQEHDAGRHAPEKAYQNRLYSKE